MKPMKVVVVGGGAAGMSAASRVKRLRPEWEVVVLERTDFISHAPCALPYYVEGLVEGEDGLSMFTPEEVRKRRKIDVRTRVEVVDIDHGAREARVLSPKGEEVVKYDRIVLATGAKPFVPDPKWLEVEGVFTLHHIMDGLTLRKAAERAKEVVVVGTGFIGVEMAEAFKRLGKKVLMLEALDQVMPVLDPDVARDVESYLRRAGIKVRKGEAVMEVYEKGGKPVAETSKGEYSADLILLSIGVRPDVELPLRAGAKLGETGAVWVDDHMWTGIEDLYAAGDNVEVKHLVTGKKTFNPLAPAANKEGYVAGTNVAGFDAEFPGIVGAAITKFCKLEIGTVGLNRRTAEKFGYEVKDVYITHGTRAHYYPKGSWIKVKLLFTKDGSLFGGQIIGREGVWGRTAALSLALQARMKLKDLFFADLPYAPPFSPAWDPLTVAARVAFTRT